MRPVPVFFFLTWLSICVAQNNPIKGIDNTLNSIEPKSSSRLDPYIRQALLKALSELEENDNQTTGFESTDETSNVDFSTQETVSDFSESSIQTPKEEIQIHSFVVNGQSAFVNSTNITPTVLDDKISILTTAGNVENQATVSRSILPYTENYQSRSLGVNNQQIRSIPSTDLISIKNEEKSSTMKPKSSTTRKTTTTTTTTTTPKPTHNDDGENIEEVDKRDVLVYQAPLVAAFTVHQDSQGLPKKVIPIYQHTNDQQLLKPLPTNNIPTSILPPKTIGNSALEFDLNVDQTPHNDFITQQIMLQRELEEKQRILEQQLRILQLQQKQQEELLQKQQYLLQLKETQTQQKNSFTQDQQKRNQYQVNRPVNNFSLQNSIQQSQSLNPNVGLHSHNSPVSIQASIPLTTNQLTGASVGSQQQLPNREAVDFLLNLRNNQHEQFPLQENHLPQGISTFLQPKPTSIFHQGLNINQVRPEQISLKQNTRVFRQESGVGNIETNNFNYNRFNTYNPIQANRFFPQLNRPHHYNSDLELKQLLMQTGFNARSPEDLNIVSKVLSLNHGVSLNNNVSNRFNFDSRRHVQPFV